MNTTYETKNKEQGMSDPNENKPGYKKTRMDGIPEGHIISDPVADAIDYSRDAMHGVSTDRKNETNHGISPDKISKTQNAHKKQAYHNNPCSDETKCNT